MAEDEQIESKHDRAARQSAESIVFRYVLPLVVAGAAAVGSLRGAFDGDVVEGDSARHAMNGAFLMDWLESGEVAQPVNYAKAYYARLPSISLPYHPPVFPAIEACFFKALGVNVLTSRIVIALFLFASCLLIYNLLYRHLGNFIVPLATILIFYSLRRSILLSTDVMLEFPTLTIATIALCFVRFQDGTWKLRDGILFGLIGGTAVWTKQHAVFVGLVPFVTLALSHNWQLLRQKTIWIATGIFSLIVLGLLSVGWFSGGVGVQGQFVNSDNAKSKILDNLLFFNSVCANTFGLIPWSLCIASALVFCLIGTYQHFKTKPAGDGKSPDHHRHAFLIAWAVCLFILLMIINQRNARYIFYAYPAIIAVGVSGLYELTRRLIHPKVGLVAVGAATAFMIATNITSQPTMLQGVGVAARMVKADSASRVLYCGYLDGSFTFAMRSNSDPRDHFVLLGMKLEPEYFEPERFEEFAHKFGVEYIILEDNEIDYPWDELIDSPTASMKLKQTIPLKVYPREQHNGDLVVYEFTNPSATPEDPGSLMLGRLGGYLGAYTGVTEILESE